MSQNLLSGFRDGDASRRSGETAERRRQPELTSGKPAANRPRFCWPRHAQAGDRALEATALTDLGVTKLSEGNPAGAIAALEAALAMARELGDREREYDIMGNLGLAMLGVGQARAGAADVRAGAGICPSPNAITWAKKRRWSGWGLLTGTCANLRRHSSCFEQALGLARLVGDRMQAANLLWYQGIQYAELGQRELAIAKAEESIALFKAMGRPQAAWYGSHLAEVSDGPVRRGTGRDAAAE